MNYTIKAVCVIIGTMIGAGFASGKEIEIFFCKYGNYGLIGIAISSILTGIIIYKVLKQIRDKEIINYNNYLECIGIHPKFKNVLNCIINIFLIFSFYVMIAGFCAYFKQEFEFSPFIISFIVSALCYVTFLKNIEGITKINTVLIPILIILILYFGLNNCNIEGLNSNLFVRNGWILSSLEYASYNSVLLIPILISLKKYTYKKEKIVSIICSIIFSLLAIILYIFLKNEKVDFSSIDLPIIYILKKFGSIYSYIYGGVIISAIYTSAISAGYSFAKNCSKNIKQYKKICFLICLTAIPISQIGFSDLVNVLYPMFGLIGLGQIFYIIFRKIKI